MSLRDEVKQLLPNWEAWYPSLFEAARDLGLIRARVCDPSSLLLSNRHSGVKSDALNAHRKQWGYADSEEGGGPGQKRRKKRRRKAKAR
jgi:hypothetical protein